MWSLLSGGGRYFRVSFSSLGKLMLLSLGRCYQDEGGGGGGRCFRNSTVSVLVFRNLDKFYEIWLIQAFYLNN